MAAQLRLCMARQLARARAACWRSCSPHAAPHWMATGHCYNTQHCRCAYQAGCMRRNSKSSPMHEHGRSKWSTNMPLFPQRMPETATKRLRGVV